MAHEKQYLLVMEIGNGSSNKQRFALEIIKETPTTFVTTECYAFNVVDFNASHRTKKTVRWNKATQLRVSEQLADFVSSFQKVSVIKEADLSLMKYSDALAVNCKG